MGKLWHHRVRDCELKSHAPTELMMHNVYIGALAHSLVHMDADGLGNEDKCMSYLLHRGLCCITSLDTCSTNQSSTMRLLLPCGSTPWLQVYYIQHSIGTHLLYLFNQLSLNSSSNASDILLYLYLQWPIHFQFSKCACSAPC